MTEWLNHPIAQSTQSPNSSILVCMSQEIEQTAAALLELSHWLGEPTRDLAIIGEGNTSAQVSEHTILIKASGSSLGTLQREQLVEVDRRPVLALVENPNASEDDVKRTLQVCRVDQANPKQPSIETFFHSLMYDLTGAKFVGHTHPIAINVLLCSRNATDITRHIMPDVIIVCGISSVFVPYTDPGIPLAREIAARIRQYQQDFGEHPRTIYLQNHGVIALGETAKQVQNVTLMAVKNARTLAATYGVGGPNFLSPKDIARIHTRPDEDVRRVQFK